MFGHQDSEPILFNTTRRDRAFSVIAHSAVVVMEYVPFLNIAIIFAIWVAMKDRSDFVRTHTIEALNFSLVGTALYVVARYLLPTPVDVVIAAAINIVLIVGCVRLALYASQGKFVPHIPHLEFVK